MKLTLILILLCGSLAYSQTPIWTKIELTPGDSTKTKLAIIDWRDVGSVFFIQPNKVKVFQLPAGRSFFPNAIYLDGFDRTKAHMIEFKVTVVGVVDPPAPVIEKIDGEAATFSANWSIHGNTTAAGWYAGTIAYSNVVGSTATYTFNGTKIELYAEKTSTHGTGTVTLDGVTTQVSFQGTKELPALIYSSPTLSPGSHTLKLTVGVGYCLIDYFQITK